MLRFRNLLILLFLDERLFDGFLIDLLLRRKYLLNLVRLASGSVTDIIKLCPWLSFSMAKSLSLSSCDSLHGNVLVGKSTDCFLTFCEISIENKSTSDHSLNQLI